MKFLPDQADWPLRLARQSAIHPEIGEKVETMIQNISHEISVPKEVLMRKKWLNALYQHVVCHKDEQDLPNYLLGWRYELLTLL